MNTNPNAKRVLLYGDSYVYGKVGGENTRLDSKARFSGVLQDMLGQEYGIIEEGLRGRTLAGENGFFPDRDGLKQFGPIIGSHLPVSLLVIFLGTNDCNARGPAPQEVADNLKKYIPVLKGWCEFLAVTEPKLLIVAPPMIYEKYFDAAMKEVFGPGTTQRSQQLGVELARVSNELNAEFLNAANFCQVTPGDGIHLDATNHRQLAEALYNKIKGIVPS